MSDASSSPDRRPSRISPTTYGGQAVLEGVMMRGRRWARWPRVPRTSRSSSAPSACPSTCTAAGSEDAVPARPDRPLGLAGARDEGADVLGRGRRAAGRRADGDPDRRPATAVRDHGANAARRVNQGNTFGQTLQWTTVAVALLFGIGVFFLLPLGAAASSSWSSPNTSGRPPLRGV